jgi:hypothetical protein
VWRDSRPAASGIQRYPDAAPALIRRVSTGLVHRTGVQSGGAATRARRGRRNEVQPITRFDLIWLRQSSRTDQSLSMHVRSAQPIAYIESAITH